MNNLKIELKRKAAHLLLGILLVILLMYGFIGKTHVLIIIIIGLALSFLSRKHKIPLVNWFLQNLERDQDRKKFPGKGFIFYFIGVYLVLLVFPLDIAMPAIMVLAFADSVGHLFGIRFGRIRHPFVSTKYLEGFIAGLIAGFIGALIFVPWHEALAASFFAMLVEGIEIKLGAQEIDDNLIIPIVAASAIWAVRFFLV